MKYYRQNELPRLTKSLQEAIMANVDEDGKVLLQYIACEMDELNSYFKEWEA